MPKSDCICGVEDVKALVSGMIDNLRRERTLARQNAHLWPCATLLEWNAEDLALMKRIQQAVDDVYRDLMRRSDRIDGVKL